MSEISKSSQSNIGGLSDILYAVQKDVRAGISLDEALLRGTTSISISQAYIDANFYNLGFLIRSANHDQVQSQGPAGTFFNHQIEARFPKDRPEIQDHVRSVGNKKLVMICRDLNGSWFLIYGCSELSDKRTGKEPKDSNSHTLRWSSSIPIQALSLTIA
jgi:hypothetical protein